MTGDSPKRQFVRAGVVFETDGFRPVWFAMGEKKVTIKEIHYSWKETEAGELFYKFTVTDGIYFYELRLSSRKMRWSARILE